MVETEPGKSVLIVAAASDGSIGLSPSATVRDATGVPVVGSPVTLSQDLGGGGYQGVLAAAPSTEGLYSIIIEMGPGQPVLYDTLRVSAKPATAHVNLSYEESTQTLFVEAWVERNGRVVLVPTSCSVLVKDKDEATIANLSSVTPQASTGAFSLSQGGVILTDNRPYNVLVSVTDADGTVQTLHGVATVA